MQRWEQHALLPHSAVRRAPARVLFQVVHSPRSPHVCVDRLVRVRAGASHARRRAPRRVDTYRHHCSHVTWMNACKPQARGVRTSQKKSICDHVEIGRNHLARSVRAQGTSAHPRATKSPRPTASPSTCFSAAHERDEPVRHWEYGASEGFRVLTKLEAF